MCPNPGLPLPRPMVPMTLDQQSQISTPAVNQPSEIHDTLATRPPIYNDGDDSSSLLTPLGSEDGNETDSVIRQERTPTPESVYSEGEETQSARCARFVYIQDPLYTEVLEGYRLFPDRPEFKLMVERRNHQKYYETEKWALSALKQRRSIFQLCQHRLSPEQSYQNRRRNLSSPCSKAFICQAIRAFEECSFIFHNGTAILGSYSR